jgi:hypothetical protein
MNTTLQLSHSAEAQISEEIEEVQAEADEIEAGWGEKIWRLASELRQVTHNSTCHLSIHITCVYNYRD